MRAVVIGAGVGGLAAGAALHRAGWQVSVCERAPVLEPVGAGISLWPNALRALDELGIGHSVRARSALGAGTGLRRPDGSWLARSDMADAVGKRFGDPLVVLARSELVDLLAGALPDGTVRTGATVVDVVPGSPGGDPAGVVLGSGERLTADLVVAADGIGSPVRAALFPATPGPVYAGYTTWRLIAPAPPGVTGTETWGPHGRRFAVVPMVGARVYCYATDGGPAGRTSPDEAARLRDLFGHWHAPIPQILASVGPDDVLHHDVHELATPLPAFTAGRVALLGDAAHAMTPELGQGGCLAIEDAVTLGALVRRVPSAADRGAALDRALRRFTDLRLPRTTRIARRSRSTGRLTQASGPVAVRVRDLVGRGLGMVPATVIARGLDPVVDWRPPDS